MHDTSLITTIAFGFTAALLFGILAKRFGLSPIVGYLLAGIAASPHTPGFVGDVDLAKQLAEIGVILLMFGVGLHFHLKDLLAVRSIAIPGALGQSTVATLACLGLAVAVGWSWQEGLVLGIAVSVASTVVLLRLLTDNGVLETPSGHAAVGWLVVEDLITVLVLVILPAFAGTKDGSGGAQDVLLAAGKAVLKLAVLGAVVAFVGARFVPWLLLRVARLRSRELFTLAVLVMSIAVATAAYVVFDASMALGAFLAGMLVGQSRFSHQAGAEILPLRDAFAVLFFVSVGMLFDFHAILKAPVLLIGALIVVLVVKPLAAFLIAIVCRHSLRTALTVAAGLAQIGEFSFILADVAMSDKVRLLPADGHGVLVACAIVSISVNPLLFHVLMKLEPWIERKSAWAPWLLKRTQVRGAEINASLPPATDGATGAIVVGYGPVGLTLTRLLAKFDLEPLIIEMNVDTVGQLRSQGRRALFGDATKHDILKEAGVARAKFLILTMPAAEVRMAVIAAARDLNPAIRIITRARYVTEVAALEEIGVAGICIDEAETAAGLAETFLHDLGVPAERVAREVAAIRSERVPFGPEAAK